LRVVNNYFSRQNDPAAGFRPHLAGGAAAPDGTGRGVVQLLCLPSSPLQNPTMAVLQQEVQVVPRDFWLESGVCTFQEIKSEISPIIYTAQLFFFNRNIQINCSFDDWILCN